MRRTVGIASLRPGVAGRAGALGRATPTRVFLAFALLLGAACDPEDRVLGTWTLAAIDGVAPAAATPVRVPFPAGRYGGDTLGANGMWHEYTVASLTLSLEPGGAFREHGVEAKRTVVRPSTYERPDYVSGAFGGDLIREPGEPGEVTASGRWILAGDSLVLTEPREQGVESLAARVRQALPAAPAEDVRAAVDAALPEAPPARWTGVLRGDRLQLRDRDGRVFSFRRAGTGG